MTRSIDLVTSPSGFPLNTGTLDFMQKGDAEAIEAIANLAGATDVIVTGCVRAGNQIGPGWVFIGGELLRFEGGNAGATTLLKRRVVAISAENENGTDVDRYITTTLFLDVTGDINFNDLRRAGSLLEIQRRAAGLVAFEPAVIVEGCAISAVTSNSLIISPGVYVLDGSFVDSPSYVGVFPVYFNAQGYTTSDPGGVRVKYDPFTSQRKEDVIDRATTRRGTLISVASNVLPNFDPITGLGKWNWLGYALADGRNATADLRTRSLVGYHPGRAEYALGEIGGSESVTLSELQMPRHQHGSPNTPALASGGIGLIRRSAAGENVTLGNSDTGNAGTEPDLKTAPLPIPPAGGSQAHENRSPFVVAIILQRL